MVQTQENDNQKDQSSLRVARSYVVLSVISVIVMIIAAYITHGYRAREIRVSFDDVMSKVSKKDNSVRDNSINIGADLSRVPNDDVIEDILNDVIPNVCKYPSSAKDVKEKCDKKPLDCLKSYEINKVIVQDLPYQDQLFIELITGKEKKKKYTVVVDLSNNYQVVYSEGEIDKKRCRDLVEADSDTDDVDKDEPIFKEGKDPKNSHYIEAEELI